MGTSTISIRLTMIFILVVPGVAAHAQPVTTPTQTPVSATVHAKRVEAMDATGFDRPLPAFSLLVPVHWRTEGGVVWTPNNPCNAMGYNFAFEAASPDGAEGISVLPTVSWSAYRGMATPQTPCPQVDLRSARAFLEWYVAQIIPGVQFLDYRPRPDLHQQYAHLAGRFDMGAGAYYETGVDAGEILIGYQYQGRDTRASVASVVVLWHSHFPGLPSQYGLPGMPDMDIFGGSNLPTFAAFAPNGHLNLKIAEMIRKSITPGPEWSRHIAEHHRTMNRINIEGARDRAAITRRTNQEISSIIHQGYQERSAIRDRGQREIVEAIRGVETYRDAVNGGTVQLDNNYRHAYQLDDGSYVLTDDEFFNPHQTFGQNGRRLTPAE